MGKALQVLAVSVGAAALVVSGTVVASAQGTSPMAYTCAGGDIPSGNYASVTVTGACAVAADAVVSVSGNVYVAAGAALDAQSAPSTITVGRNVIALPGSLLGLGCQPDTDHAGHPCTVEPDGRSTITVNGNVTTIGADTVLLNGITVNGNVTLVGGGGDIPWAIKNNTIGGNLTIIGVRADLLGVHFNPLAATRHCFTSPCTDGDSAAPGRRRRKHGARNLTCFGLAPGVSGGFIPGEVNHVSGNAIGQCAGLVGGSDDQ